MIVSFKDRGTEEVFNGEDTRAARKTCPESLWRIARRKLDYLQSAVTLTDLKSPPNNKLEKLKKERSGQHTIRINDKYRICFVWTEKGAAEVEIADYH